MNFNSLKNYFVKFDYLIILFLLLIIYSPLGAVSAQHSDSGELATAAVTGALIHPSGYPLYWLIANILTLLPFDAFKVMSLFSAFCQALAVVVLYRLCLSQNLSRTLALSLALAFAFFETSIKAASDVEVFALHHLLLVLIISESFNQKRPLWLGFFCGLAAANHQTSILIAPLVLSVLISKDRGMTFRNISRCFIAALPGLSLYFLLFVPELEDLTYFGPIENFQDWFNHILRSAYGTFNLHSGSEDPNLYNYFYKFLKTISIEIPALVLLPLIFISKSNRKSAVFYGWCGSLALYILFLCQLKFSGNAAVQILEIAGRFFTGAALFLLCGLIFLTEFRRQALIALFLIIPVVINFIPNYRAADARQDLLARAETEQIFATIPENSVYFAQSDRECFALAYEQRVNKRRPDLIVLISGLSNQQYLRLISRRFEIFKDINTSQALSLADIYNIVRAKNREIFSARINNLPTGLKLQGWGNLYKWIPASQPEDITLAVKSILTACANFPQFLADTPSERQATWIAIRSKFINPLERAAKIAAEPDKQKLEQAFESALNMDFRAMREACRS